MNTLEKFFRNNSKEYQYMFWLFVGSFAFLVIFQIKPPVNGDSYVYARSIQTFDGPIIHSGYFLIGFIFHFFLGKLGNTPLQTLGHMSVFFGSLCVVCMYFLTLELTKDRKQSLIASLILLFSGAFWVFSEYGEVYVPQLAFVFLSVAAILKTRPLLASLCLLAAISITPTSCLVFPGLAYLIYIRKWQKRQVGWYIGPLILAMVVVLLAGFSTATNIIKWALHPPAVFLGKQWSLSDLFLNIAYRLSLIYGKSFSILLFFALYGFVYLYRKEKRVLFLTLIFLFPFCLYVLNLNLFSGDHLIITFIAISMLASYGIYDSLRLAKVGEKTKWVMTLCLLFMHFSFSYTTFIDPEARDAMELQRVIHRFASEYQANAIMISDFTFGMAFWSLVENEDNFHLLTGRPAAFLREGGASRAAHLDRLRRKFWINEHGAFSFASEVMGSKELFLNRPIYFVDRKDWPTRFLKFVLPRSVIEWRHSEILRLPRFQKSIGDKARFRLLIDSPLYPVYLMDLIPEKI